MSETGPAALAARLSRLDREQVDAELARLAGGRRWMRPLVFALGALFGLLDAVVTLLRNWRLVLLEITPAVWLGAITWQWRRLVFHGGQLPAVHGWVALLVFVGVVAATAAAYWCNATFAFTVGRTGTLDIRAAFARARAHASFVWGAALATALVHASVSVWVARTSVLWFALALGAVALAQMYAMVAVPVTLVGSRPEHRPSTQDRLRWFAASLGLSGVAATPGFALNRIAVLLIGLGAMKWAGFVVLAVAILLQIAAVSSASAVKLVSKLEPTGHKEHAA